MSGTEFVYETCLTGSAFSTTLYLGPDFNLIWGVSQDPVVGPNEAGSWAWLEAR